MELFTFGRSFDAAQLTARGVSIAVAADALDITGTVPASDSGVIFPLPEKSWDLSRFRFVEADIENTGDLNGWSSEYWNIAEWTRAG